jgi:hypothetical protein
MLISAFWTTRQVRIFFIKYRGRGSTSYAEGDYIDLTSNPERYTGYSGPSAARVWRSIYEENCFGQAELTLLSGKAPAAVTLPETLQDPLRDENGNVKEQCLEKRVYYKIISGEVRVVVFAALADWH